MLRNSRKVNQKLKRRQQKPWFCECYPQGLESKRVRKRFAATHRIKKSRSKRLFLLMLIQPLYKFIALYILKRSTNYFY
ncbi:hypothetical protein FXE99_11225 [Vibrio mimicus]|nr:hypothetical protein FXE99_11225 [Vibrio mimicus]